MFCLEIENNWLMEQLSLTAEVVFSEELSVSVVVVGVEVASVDDELTSETELSSSFSGSFNFDIIDCRNANIISKAVIQWPKNQPVRQQR